MIEWRFGLALALGSLAVNTAQADPHDARVAWAALLRAAHVVVPAGSGCEGDYGQKGPARLGDVLAMQLAYMHAGDNSVVGRCDAQGCRVELNRRAGEDVSSARIDFKLRAGRLLTASLRCVITP